ncbi:putative hemolysin [Kerstersia sp.]|uniref:putative hemolysin n=1 Tax=Kerstersia sp. TaxID=1930783 RepID=UPI003F8E61F6
MPGVSFAGRRAGLCAAAFAALGAVLLAACGASGGSQGEADEAASLPNPASEYCEEKGGTVSIAETPAGQVGICHFPDGSSIDEWAQYRRDFPEAVEIDKP